MDENDNILGLINFGYGDNNDAEDGGLDDLRQFGDNGGQDGGLQNSDVIYLRNFFDAQLPLPLPVITADDLPGTSAPLQLLFSSGERQAPLLDSQDPGNQLMNMWNDLTKEREERQFVEAQKQVLEAEVQKLRLELEEVKQQKEDLVRQLQAAKPKRVLRTKEVLVAEIEELKENIKTVTTKLANVEVEWLKTKDDKMELQERLCERLHIMQQALQSMQQELQSMQKERNTELQSRIEQQRTLIEQQNTVIEDLRFQLDPYLPPGHLPPPPPPPPGHEAI